MDDFIKCDNKEVTSELNDLNKKVCDSLLYSTDNIKRYDLYLNKSTKQEIKVSVENYSIQDLVTAEDYVKGSHLVFGSSDAGKTLYCTMVIKALVEIYPNKFKIVILSKSEDAFLKLSLINKIYPNPSFDLNEILRYSSMSELVEFYTKLNKEKSSSINNYLKDNQVSQNLSNESASIDDESKAAIRNSHYIFYFDDCAEIFCDKKNTEFFNIFFPKFRHANITILYSVQMLQNFIPSIRTNTRTVTIIGDMTHKDCNIAHSGFSQISQIFNTAQIFTKFMSDKGKFFNNSRAILTFKKQTTNKKGYTNKKYLYIHEIEPKLAGKIDEYEKIIKY